MKEKPMILSALDLSYFSVVQRMYLIGGRRKFIQRSRVLTELLGGTAIVALSLAALESCDQPASNTPTTQNPGSTASGIALSLGAGSLSLVVGGTRQMTATVTPATTADKSLVWSCSDPAIASVSSGGLVTALSPGAATLTVARSAGSETASCDLVVTAFVEPGIPLTGLVAEWLFEGNANDTSGKGLGGINHGATLTADRFGVADRAFKFNGSSDYIDYGDDAALALTNDFTIAAWVRPDTFDKLDGIISKYQSSAGFTLRLGYDDPYSAVNFAENGADHGISSTYAIKANGWYLIVATMDSTNTAKLYINGVASGSATITPGSGADHVMIGRDYGSRYFDGAIDDVRIYDRVLTEGEIQSLVTAGGFVADTNLDVFTPAPPACTSNCPTYSCTCVSFYCSCQFEGCQLYGVYY
jgi:hypothetical protein